MFPGQMVVQGGLPIVTVVQAENSDVSSEAFVAVAVMTLPGVTGTGKVAVNGVTQLAPLLIVIDPINTSPCPKPDASQIEFEKNSIVKLLFGVLSRLPVINVETALDTAVAMTGKF